jgi:hypothetical protein
MASHLVQPVHPLPSGSGGPDGAPHALNDLDPLTPVCYASGVGAMGYPRIWRPHHRRNPGSDHPGARPAGGICVVVKLGSALPGR